MIAHCAKIVALSSLLSFPSLIEAFLGPAPIARSPSTAVAVRDRTPAVSCVMSDQQQSTGRSSPLLADAPATLISEAGREARGRPGGMDC